jgi:ornithine cyclodeaminase
MKKIDEETLFSGGGKIFVDSKEACLDESGELITANATEEQLTKIGEILALDDKRGVYPTGNIVFKCVGMGIMDLAVSRTLLEIAKESGGGVTVEGF